jgi:hypothetical protein
MDQRLSLKIKTFHFAILQILYFSTKRRKKSLDLDLQSLKVVSGDFQGKKETFQVQKPHTSPNTSEYEDGIIKFLKQQIKKKLF